jgi:hypothetical protein
MLRLQYVWQCYSLFSPTAYSKTFMALIIMCPKWSIHVFTLNNFISIVKEQRQGEIIAMVQILHKHYAALADSAGLEHFDSGIYSR